jgi:hypothetical protein
VVGDYVYHPGRDDGSLNRRTVSFDLGGRVTEVNGAWIRWSGSVTAGWGDCQGGQFRWASGIAVYLDHVGLDAWRAGVAVDAVLPERIFNNQNQDFVSSGDPGWDFLSDGRGEVIVSIYAALYICGEMRVPPTATLGDATLVLDAVIEPVPVQPTTWGRVKALYRTTQSVSSSSSQSQSQL